MSHRKRRAPSSVYQIPLFDVGMLKEESKPSGRRKDKDATTSKASPTYPNLVQLEIPFFTRLVSSRGQQGELVNQTQELVNRYPGCEVITDIGSGLNLRRRGLLALLERVYKGDIGCIVVAHRDRLARFGFELIEWICEQHDCKLVVLHQKNYSHAR